MKIEQLEKKVKLLIAQDKLDDTIKLLNDFFTDDLEVNEIIIQSANYNSIRKKERKGTVDASKVDLALNKLRSDILEFISSKKEEVIIIPDIKFTKHKNQLDQYPKPKSYFTGRIDELKEFGTAIKVAGNLIAIDGPGGIGKTQFVSMGIKENIPHEKVVWYDCKTESHFDTMVTLAGFPELLEGDKKTNREKFSAFKDKLEENDYFLFLDNFQKTNNKPIFKEFLIFIQEYLKKGAVVVITRDKINALDLNPKRIHIEGFKDQKLEYAKNLIDHSYEDLIDINDSDLTELCEELQGYPLAIDFAILLLSDGAKHTDIISEIVSAEGVEAISTRLLNAIFERPDATEEEKQFMLQFSVFTGAVHEDIVYEIISKETVDVVTRKLRKKNLISFSNKIYDMHALVRAFCYEKLSYKENLHKTISEHFIGQRNEDLDPALEERIFYHLLKSNQLERIEKEIEENGRKFIMQGQLALVQELIEKLKDLNIKNATFDIFNGDISETQGEWEQAIKYYSLAKGQEKNINVKAQGIIKYGEVLFRKGKINEAFILFKEAHTLTSDMDFLIKERARAINDIGLVFKVFGDLDQAFKSFQEGLNIRIEIGDKQGIATSLSNIANIYNNKGDLIKALEYIKKSLKINTEVGNKRGVANSLGHIGNIYIERGDLEIALDYHQQSLKLENEFGNKQGIATSFGNIGYIYIIKGDMFKGLDYHQKSLKINTEIGNKQGIASALSNIGSINITRGDLVNALDYHQRSLKINTEIGNKQAIAVALGNIGNIYINKGDLVKSLDYYQRSLKIKNETGNKQGIATTLGNIGNIYINRDDLKIALDYHQKSLKLENETGNRLGIATSLASIGNIYIKKGDLVNALGYHQRSMKIRLEVGNKLGISNSNHNIGTIYTKEGEKDDYLALKYFFNALSILNNIGAKIDSNKTITWINGLRSELGLQKFKTLAQEVFEKLDEEIKKHLDLKELLNEPKRAEKKVGRNEPCPCGSGKKFKQCHGK